MPHLGSIYQQQEKDIWLTGKVPDGLSECGEWARNQISRSQVTQVLPEDQTVDANRPAARMEGWATAQLDAELGASRKDDRRREAG